MTNKDIENAKCVIDELSSKLKKALDENIVLNIQIAQYFHECEKYEEENKKLKEKNKELEDSLKMLHKNFDKVHALYRDERRKNREQLKKQMSEVEVLEWLYEGCFDERFANVMNSDTSKDIYEFFDRFTAEEIVDKITDYEKNHSVDINDMVKEEQTFEWVFEVNVTTADGRIIDKHYCIDEINAEKICEKYVKENGWVMSIRKICRRKE